MSLWRDPDIKHQFMLMTIIRALLSGIRYNELRFLTGSKAQSGVRTLVTDVICSPVYEELQRLGIVTQDNQDQFWINAMRILFDETMVSILKCPPEKLRERYLAVIANNNHQKSLEAENKENKGARENSPRANSHKEVASPINIDPSILIPFYVTDYSTIETGSVLPRVALPYLLDYINALFDVLVDGESMEQNIALLDFQILIQKVSAFIRNTFRFYKISIDSPEFQQFDQTYKRLGEIFSTYNNKGSQVKFIHQ